MGDTYDIDKFNRVIPYTAGRKNLDTNSYRDATELELTQRDRIAELEAENERLNNFIKELVAEDEIKYVVKGTVYLDTPLGTINYPIQITKIEK